MRGERGDRMVLVGDGDRARFFKLGPAGRAEPDAARAMVLFILRTRDQSACFHARKCRTDRIRIARHEIGQRALREPLLLALTQPAQDAELIRRDPKMFDSIAKAWFSPHHARRSRIGSRFGAVGATSAVRRQGAGATGISSTLRRGPNSLSRK